MSSLFALIALVTAVNAQTLPVLNYYAACKYYFEANRLHCIRPSGQGEVLPIAVDGDSAQRRKLMKKAMRGVGFKVHHEEAGVTVYEKTYEAAD